jgi:hypothetical protein
MKKHGYTLDQHIALRMVLVETRRRLQTESVKLSNAHPKADRAARILEHAVKELDQARALLNSHVFRENPGRGSDLIGVYCPSQEDRRAVA